MLEDRTENIGTFDVIIQINYRVMCCERCGDEQLVRIL